MNFNGAQVTMIGFIMECQAKMALYKMSLIISFFGSPFLFVHLLISRLSRALFTNRKRERERRRNNRAISLYLIYFRATRISMQLHSASWLSIAILLTATTIAVDDFVSVYSSCNSPIYCEGPILRTVQLARLFPDSKTFVDMVIRPPHANYR